MVSGRDKVGIRALIAIVELWCIVLCSLFTTAAIRLKFVIVVFLVHVFCCLNFVPCLFKLREELRTFLLLNQQRKVNIPFREKFFPIHPAERGKGRPRATVAPEVEQEPRVEHEVPVEGQAAFAAGMAGINQGLATLSQAMPLVEHMLQQRNQEMTDADADR